MVERTGIEPVTPTMSTWCSPAELTLPNPSKPRIDALRANAGQDLRRIAYQVKLIGRLGFLIKDSKL